MPAASSRPDRLLDVSGPQERVQRRIMEQIVDCVPVVPLLDAPVPQVVDQLVEVLRPLDTVVPEQVIEAPKITLHDAILQRAVLLRRLWRNSWWKCRRSCLSLSASSRVQMATLGGSSLGQRGSTGGEWAPLTPSGPPHRVTPPGQGGMEILAAATVADVVVVDVPVNMQHKFQQSLVLPQFINRVVAIPETGMHSVVVLKTVEMQRQVLVQKVQKTVKLPQVQQLWCCGRCFCPI